MKMVKADNDQRLSYRQIASLIIVITMISKVLGFIREVLMTKYFGSSGETDAFFFALSMTNFFAVYLVSAINTTFIPVLADADADDTVDMKRVSSNILNVVALVSVVLMIVGIILIRPLTHVIAGGIAAQSQENFELTVTLSRIAMLNILFPGILGILTGYLRFNRSFLAPAMIGFPLNLIFYVYLIAFSQRLGVVGLTWISVLATASQVLILLPSLKRRHFSMLPVLNFREPYLAKMAKLSVPILFSTIIAEAGTVIDKGIASWLPTGSITYLQYGGMISGLVISIFISSIATIDFPAMSKAYTSDNPEQAHRIMIRTFRIIIILVIPVAIFLFFFSKEVLQILFQRGKFTHEHTLVTAGVLSMYCIGLPASAFRAILNNAFHASMDTKSPAILSLVSLVVYFGLALTLIGYLGASGIALASSLSVIVVTFMLAIKIQKRERFRLINHKEFWLIGKIALSSTICYIFMKFSLPYAKKFLTFRFGDTLGFIAISLVAGSIFILSCYLLNIEEVKALLHLVRARFSFEKDYRL
jgi:putative peptidoglycan lipid II flippase